MRWIIGVFLTTLCAAILDLVPLVGRAAPADAIWIGLASASTAIAFLVLPSLLVLPALQLLRRPAMALERRPRLSLGLGLVLLVTGLGLRWIDGHMFVRLYLHLHLVLMSVALAFMSGGFALVVFRRRPPMPPRPVARRLMILGGTLGWAVLAAVALVRTIERPFRRFLAVERTTCLSHGLLLLQDRWDILSPAKPAEEVPEIMPVERARQVHAPHRASILWITVDSMRADSVPAGGAIAQLGAEGVRFTRAYSAACWTIHSMTAAMTSRLPAQLRFTPVSIARDLTMTPHAPDDALVTTNLKATTPVPWDEDTPTLARLLRDAGWQTATAIAYIFYLPRAGLTRDFERIDERPLREHNLDNEGLTSSALTDAAIDFLAQHDPARPFFLWLHYMDAHAPYLADDAAAVGQGPRARYDSELRLVDAQIGRLLADLRQRGLDDDTIVIIHADHGEEFGEHGGQYHATTLYDEQVHVPFIVWLPPPFGARPAVWHTPVSLLDVLPSLLDLLGEKPVPTVGEDIALAFLGAAEPAAHPVFLDCTRFGRSRRGMVDGKMKLMAGHVTGGLEIYDLEADPGEQHNLVEAADPAWMKRADLLYRMP